MAYIDIFNGDADGICALTQLHRAQPRDAQLVTGVKRDISLVDKVEFSAGDEVTVLDIALEKNLAGVEKALAAGAQVFYVDHHFPGDIPQHDKLRTLINPAADVCTSVLVNQHLEGAFVEWAVVGAFGDNLKKTAQGVAKNLGLSESQLVQLEDLGIYINYNGYGPSIEDLHFPPAELFKRVSQFDRPFEFINSDRETFEKLEHGYGDDMAKAKALEPYHQSAATRAFVLPNEAWARRVSGVYSNDLANQAPELAHAVITERADGDGYVISVRAPLNNKTGADELCREFPTGGGRKAAAGVNHLPPDQLDTFVSRFNEFYTNL